MDSIAKLKREKAKLLAKQEVHDAFARRNLERKKLKKEIIGLKYGKAIAKGKAVKKHGGKIAKQTGRGLLKGGKVAKKMAVKIGRNVAAAENSRPSQIPGINPKKKRKFEAFY